MAEIVHLLENRVLGLYLMWQSLSSLRFALGKVAIYTINNQLKFDVRKSLVLTRTGNKCIRLPHSALDGGHIY